jgi:uncharacterized membrane protein
MRSQNDKKTSQRYSKRYSKANSVLEAAFVVLFMINLLFKHHSFRNSALYLTLVSLVFTVLSGYVAFLHSKLPKDQREKPDWLDASDFSTHPYFTFILFVVYSLIGLFYLLT